MAKEKNEDAPKGGLVKAVDGMPAVPDFMKADIGKGVENIAMSQAEMPRLSLMQGLSDEIQTYDGVKVGEFFHTLLERSLGNSLPVVVLHISERYVLWNPRWAGGGILARADDAIHWVPPQGEFSVKAYKDRDKQVKWKLAPTVAASGLAEWGSYDPEDPKAPPAATLCFVVVVAIPSMPEIGAVALMLQRTAIPPARKLIGKLKMSRAPAYGTIYQMSSFDDERGPNKFKNYRFTASGFVTDESEYAVYKNLHEQFAKDGVNLKDLEKAQGEGGDAEVGGDKNAGASEKY